MNDRYYATATEYATMEFGLITGQKYIVESSYKHCGMADVYDLDGNFIKTAQIDDFTNYQRI